MARALLLVLILACLTSTSVVADEKMDKEALIKDNQWVVEGPHVMVIVPDSALQWRVCFRWTDAGPEDVEIVDYH
jgi:hypothetical protein